MMCLYFLLFKLASVCTNAEFDPEKTNEDIIGNILLFGQYTFFIYLYYIICIPITLFSIVESTNKDILKGVIHWVSACLRNLLETILDPIMNPEKNLVNPLSNI
jgi:hypothetical protein